MRRLAIILLLAACGDQIVVDQVDEATSGTRLKAEWLFYGDGSRQIAPDAYFDTALHVRCTPRAWADGSSRCVPEADAAYYIDATCETAVGYAEVIGKPRHFLAYDKVNGEQLPAVLYHASTTAIDPPAQLYDRVDGVCKAKGAAPPDFPWFEISGVGDTVELTERELDEGDRVALRVRESADGLHVPLGLRDRDLDVACRPDRDACVPITDAVSDAFLDPDCEVPGLIAPEGEPVPAFVQVPGVDGCPSYHRTGAPVTGTLYTRRGTTCFPELGIRGRVLGPALELAPLAREIETETAHRLQRIALTSGTLRLHDVQMFDTATRAECTPTAFETVVRCLPAATVPAVSLFAAGCQHEIRIAEVPARSCTQAAFAAHATGVPDELELYAIGEPTSAVFYDTRFAGCALYNPPPGTVPHRLGPVLPAETFVGGHPAGER